MQNNEELKEFIMEQLLLTVTILEDRELLQKMVDEMYDELPERAPGKKRQ